MPTIIIVNTSIIKLNCLDEQTRPTKFYVQALRWYSATVIVAVGCQRHKMLHSVTNVTFKIMTLYQTTTRLINYVHVNKENCLVMAPRASQPLRCCSR